MSFYSILPIPALVLASLAKLPEGPLPTTEGAEKIQAIVSGPDADWESQVKAQLKANPGLAKGVVSYQTLLAWALTEVDREPPDPTESSRPYYRTPARMWKLAETLIAYGADLEREQITSEETLLTRFAAWGSLPQIEFLIAKGANVNARVGEGSGRTPLFYLASIQERTRDEPLPKAIINKHILAAEALIRAKAQVDVICDSGETPLYAAASRANARMVEFLVSKGANVNYMVGENSLLAEMLLILQEKGDDGALPPNKRIAYRTIVECLKKHGAKDIRKK